MSRGYKVYGICTFVEGKQVHAVIASKTKKLAAEKLGMGIQHFSKYSSVTGNKEDIQAAMSKPETVFYKGKEESVVAQVMWEYGWPSNDKQYHYWLEKRNESKS